MRFSNDFLRSPQRESHGEPQRFRGSEVQRLEPPNLLRVVQRLLRKDSLMIPQEFPWGLLDIP
eukprot:12167210-Karenia_brevis.AAC.1